MRLEIHHYYDQLFANERAFVDGVFSRTMFADAKAADVELCGDDRVERAVDALARAIIESRSDEGYMRNLLADHHAKHAAV